MLNKAMGTEIRCVFPWKEGEQTGKGMKKPPGVTECSISFFFSWWLERNIRLSKLIKLIAYDLHV